MSMLEINGTGYAEKDLEHNWAAEYARREIAQLENQKKDRLEANREHEGLTEMINTGLLGKKDKAEANREHDELKEKLNTGLAGKADKTQYASINQAGLIKLYSGSGVNRSGLVVGEDGTTYVACSTNGGITRDGAGGLKIMDGGVNGNMIAHRTITRNNIAMKSVGEDEIDDWAIVTRHIGSKQITTAQLADFCITNYQMGANAVQSYAIADGAVSYEKMAIASVGAEQLRDDAIENAAIADAAVTNEKIADNTISFSKISMGYIQNDTDYSLQRINNGIYTVQNHPLTGIQDLGVLIQLPNIFAPDKEVYQLYINQESILLRFIQKDEMEVNPSEWTEIKAQQIDSYSTIPQRVGTWINGMPIWRVAFKQELTDEDRQRKLFDITGNLPIISMNDAFILNETASLYTGRPCMLEDRPLNSYDAHLLKGEWDLSGITNLSFFDGVYGWVEFGTQESNIRKS